MCLTYCLKITSSSSALVKVGVLGDHSYGLPSTSNWKGYKTPFCRSGYLKGSGLHRPSFSVLHLQVYNPIVVQPLLSEQSAWYTQYCPYLRNTVSITKKCMLICYISGGSRWVSGVSTETPFLNLAV